MFTVVKVRGNLVNYDEDPGWYEYPEGTVAFKSDATTVKSPDEKGSRP